MEAVIFTGLQAAGKSTFYAQHFLHTHVRISLDLLRTRNRERRFLALCLELRQRFVVDNTNPTAVERARFIEPAREADFRVIGYYFEPEVPGSLVRNAGRAGRQRVPPVAIYGTRKRLEPPRLDEGFDQLYLVRVAADGGFQVEEWPSGRGGSGIQVSGVDR